MSQDGTKNWFPLQTSPSLISQVFTKIIQIQILILILILIGLKRDSKCLSMPHYLFGVRGKI